MLKFTDESLELDDAVTVAPLPQLEGIYLQDLAESLSVDVTLAGEVTTFSTADVTKGTNTVCGSTCDSWQLSLEP